MEVIQRIVHKAHVPLIVETQTAAVRGLCHAGVIGGILRYQYTVRNALLEALVHDSDKFNAAAVNAAFFFTLPVQYPAYGVHSYTVEVKFFKPVIRT